MSRSSQYVVGASVRGGVVGPNGAIDAFALTDSARTRTVRVPVAAFTINSTVPGYGGPMGFRGIVLAAYLSAHVAPAGGTLAVNAKVYDKSATTAVTVAIADPETLTADQGLAMTLQTANDTFVFEADDTVIIDSVADNNAVGTAIVGGYVTLVCLPLEPADGASTRTGTPAGL
jgi:hypothetical protein